MKFAGERQIILRRSRGLAPNYLDVQSKTKQSILAMGAHLKSAFTFVPDKYIYVSQYFGNLDNYEVLRRFQNTAQQFTKVFSTRPKTILVDRHPQYQSTIYGKELADELNAELIEIQHHKAHFTSVLGEHELFDSEERVLGVIWDGTGYGDDEQIWGGEFFSYHNHAISRLSHFEYLDWIAGDKFSKDVRLPLLSVLTSEKRYLIKDKFSKTEWNIYNKLIQNNSLKTSSVGRLFDAIASTLNISDHNTYEGESAMQLESIAASYDDSDLLDVSEFTTEGKVDSKTIVFNVLTKYSEGISKARLARSFIFSLAKIIILVSEEHNFKIIAVSGGVFQNTLLLNHLSDLCKQHHKVLKINRKLSSNDENISFGQLMYYQHIKADVLSNSIK